jgi:hypothetical protein
MIKKLVYILIIIGVLAGTFWFMSQPPQTTKNNLDSSDITSKISPTPEILYDNPDLIFYWGEGCPHCENVKEWLTKNNSDNKIKINSKEVYQNKDNQKNLLETVQKYCPNLKENDGIGVPTAFDPINNKCLQGDVDIIKFLSEKLIN